jgi:hypothetical protein
VTGVQPANHGVADMCKPGAPRLTMHSPPAPGIAGHARWMHVQRSLQGAIGAAPDLFAPIQPSRMFR